MTGLPKDPVMMLSVVNMKLRDFYGDLDALCEDMQADKGTVIEILRGINYEYDRARNQFV